MCSYLSTRKVPRKLHKTQHKTKPKVLRRRTRSWPPPWMSITGPRMFSIMAEHSMCHPGRPRPQGLSQNGSPSFAAFHSATSAGCLLRVSAVTRLLPPVHTLLPVMQLLQCAHSSLQPLCISGSEHSHSGYREGRYQPDRAYSFRLHTCVVVPRDAGSHDPVITLDTNLL